MGLWRRGRGAGPRYLRELSGEAVVGANAEV